MRNLKVLLVACLAALLGACGETTTPPADSPDTGAGKADTGSCALKCGSECCQGPEVCHPDNDTCCTPSCQGKQCGDDGCGGECGTCSPGTTCSTASQCVVANLCPAGKCTGEAPVCNPSTGACECTASSCTGGKVCAASKTCQAELCPAGKCTGETPSCNAGSGACECTVLPNSCTGGKTCDATTRQCKTDLCAGVTCTVQGEACDAADGKCHCNPVSSGCAADWTCDAVDRRCYPATDPCTGKTCADPSLPVCDKQTGACVCTSTPDSCGAGKKCQAGACVVDLCPLGKCTGETPYCAPATGVCECVASSCTGGQVCDAVSKLCKAPDLCPPGKCTGETPFCNATSGACECGAATCTGGKTCSPSSKTCVSVDLCLSVTCGPQTPCNPANGLCECTATSCTGGTVCSAATKTCVSGSLCQNVTCLAETPCNPANGLCECTATSCVSPKVCNSATKQCQTGGTDPLVSCAPVARQYAGLSAASQWCDAKAKVVCDRLANCCVLGTGQYATCVAYEEHQCNQTDLTARLAANALALDVSKAKACLDAEAAKKTCSTGTCEVASFLAPKAAVNGACLGQLQPGSTPPFTTPDCLNGYCTRTTGTCGGVCHAYVALGGTCDTSVNKCNLTNTYCDTSLSQCVPTFALGASCTGSFQCGLGNYCATTCKPYLPAGSPCTTADRCNAPSACVIGDGMSSGTCVLPGTVAEGGACRKNTSADCAEGLFCLNGTTAGVCTRFKADGASCAGYWECGPYSDCVGNLCVAKQDLGGPCVTTTSSAATDFGCKYGLVCQAGKCARQGDLTATCATDKDCLRYLQCTAGKCTTAATVGTPCWHDAQCPAGYCNRVGTALTGICAAYLPNGASCSSTAQCTSGECEGSTGAKVCRPNCTY